MKKLKIKTISQLQDHIKSTSYPQRFLAFFSLECAEYAISFIKYPDERVVKCIDITTKYLNGNATLDELVNAYYAASSAAASIIPTAATTTAAVHAAYYACYTVYYAVNASYAATTTAAYYASSAASSAAAAANEKEVINIFMKHYNKLTDLEKALFEIKEVA